MLHGACIGEEAGAWGLPFFRVKWLQAAVKGSLCVRQVRAGLGVVRSVYKCWFDVFCEFLRLAATWCFGSLGCKTHCNGRMNVAWALCWGGSRSMGPSVFPCKAAAAGDEGELLCEAVAILIASRSVSSPLVFCSVWLFMCA